MPEIIQNAGYNCDKINRQVKSQPSANPSFSLVICGTVAIVPSLTTIKGRDKGSICCDGANHRTIGWNFHVRPITESRQLLLRPMPNRCRDGGNQRKAQTWKHRPHRSRWLCQPVVNNRWVFNNRPSWVMSLAEHHGKVPISGRPASISMDSRCWRGKSYRT